MFPNAQQSAQTQTQTQMNPTILSIIKTMAVELRSTKLAAESTVQFIAFIAGQRQITTEAAIEELAVDPRPLVRMLRQAVQTLQA